MSYFYKHLKGFTTSATKYYIDFESIDNGMTPQLTYTTSDNSTNSLGYLITSNMTNGYIAHPFDFRNQFILKTKQISLDNIGNSNFTNTLTTNDNNIIQYDSGIKISSNTNISSSIISNNTSIPSATFKFSYESLIDCYRLTTKDANTDISKENIKINFISSASSSRYIQEYPISFLVHTSSSSQTYQGFGINRRDNDNDSCYVRFNIPIESSSYIQGTYFNATSDKRAKTDIIQSTFSALDIINKLTIYNFKYKSDNSNSIGIIAQEALKVNTGGFDLVINPQASGENGDYMSVKESKLVYIAWKAIQEQQKIIDNQSKEIEELKQLVKTLIQK